MNLKIKILVVDDFESMRRIIKGTLKTIGYTNIFEASDGVNAMNILMKEKIDLIISDWLMPNMNGLEFLKTVRSNDKLKHIPFIMVTAEGQKKNVINAVNSGVSSYIIKPFTPETLRKKLQIVLKGT